MSTGKLLFLITAVLMGACVGCGGKSASSGAPTPNSATSRSTPDPRRVSAGPAGTVKLIYDLAIQHECGGIPPLLSAESKSAVGSSKADLDALCDAITENGKMTSFQIKSETRMNDTATVKITRAFNDGTHDEKDERVRMSDDKWLVDR